MREFQDKVAVVTGAASGMGRAFALDFARRGMRVVLADIEAEPLAAAGVEVGALGAQHLEIECDVAQLDAVQAMADAAFDRFGAVHVLCNNAGVGVGGPLFEATHKEWEWVIGVNLWGVIHGVETFVPRMVAQKQGGHIVNTASMAGMRAGTGMGLYNTSKFAVVGLSEALNNDLKPHGIAVSVLCPLGVNTGIFESTRNKPHDMETPKHEIGDFIMRETTWLDPDEVSTIVMEAIEEERLYIFTHPETEAIMEQRVDALRQHYPEALAPPQPKPAK